MKLSRHWPWFLLVPLLLIGLVRVRFDAEVLNLLPSEVPAVRGLKLYQEHFSTANELLITLEASSADQAYASAQRLAEALRAESNLVARVVWQPPWQESPAQAAELMAYLWLNQDPAVFSALLQRLQGAPLRETLQQSLARLATSFNAGELARLSYDPLHLLSVPGLGSGSLLGTGEELFASAEGTFRVLHVEARPPLPGYRECHAWLQSIQSSVQTLRERGELEASVQMGYTGRPAFLSEIARGMERDIMVSVGSTFLIIAALFYSAHRRWKPLLWLSFMLLLILGGTTAQGGLAFGVLNVVSLGFAAILLGLSVDYGLVLYHEATAHPGAGADTIRRAVTPAVAWSAATTAAAFALLNFSSLPGLRQLGSLVAAGVLLAALIMLTLFLPPLLRATRDPHHRESKLPSPSAPSPSTIPVRLFSALLLAGGLLWIWRAPPSFDNSANALRPAHSEAYRQVERIQAALGQTNDPLWLLITAADAETMRQRLDEAGRALGRLQAEGRVDRFTLPTPLWPHPAHQEANRARWTDWLPQRASLNAAVLQAGYNTNALGVLDAILGTWETARRGPGLYWPDNPASSWVLNQMMARDQDGLVVAGLVHAQDPVTAARLTHQALPGPDYVLSGWRLLGPSLFAVVEEELVRILAPMFLVMVLCLSLAFRTVRGVVLSLASVALSGLLLAAVMQLMDWSWNLMNLMALPLLVGVGLDYSIHVQLALRRHHHNTARMRQTIGRALLLCAATSAAGFGSLALSSNAGLASLGRVCAVGLGCAYLTAVYLLPVWCTPPRK